MILSHKPTLVFQAQKLHCTALHCVKLRQEPLLYYQSGSVLLFFLISVWLPLPLKLLLLLEELLLPPNHKLGGVAGEG